METAKEGGGKKGKGTHKKKGRERGRIDER